MKNNVKQKSFITLLISSLVFLMALSGCSNTNNQQGNTVKEIKHLGGVTKISGVPKNVVALEFSIVDNLYQLGIKPVGIADDADGKRIIEPIRTFAKGYTSVGKRAQPNLETLQTLKPDFIIADAKRHTEIYDQLSAIAPTILVKSLEGSYADLEQSFKTIAAVFNQENKADEVIKNSNEQIEKVKQNLASKPIASKKLMPIVPEAKSINIHTSSSYIGNVIEKIGLKSSVTSKNVYSEMTLEQLNENKPEVMLYMRKTEGTIVDTWKGNTLYQGIPAVANNEVKSVDPEVWSRFRGYESLKMILSDFERLGNEVK